MYKHKTMKNIYYIKTMRLIFVISPMLFLAQFNTLTPIPIQKKEPTNYFEKEKTMLKEKEKSDVKEDKKKQPRTSSKNALKQELDSIKTMLLKYTLENNHKTSLNYKKFEDSLMSFMQNNLTQPVRNNMTIKKYDFVEDSNNIITSKIYMPLNKRLTITSPYGTRIHPIFGGAKHHNGIDLAASYEHVYSVLDGIVTESGWDSKGGGHYIKINHSGRFETAYLHLSQMYYRVGEQVKAGYIIGKSGNSGNSTGPHLHFSVKEYGNSINPLTFLNDLIKVNNLIALSYEHK